MTEWQQQARQMLARQGVFDAHVDTIGFAVDLGTDLSKRQAFGHLDLVRGKEGGLGTVVFVAWPDPEVYGDTARERAQAMIASTHQLAERAPDQLVIVRDADELARAHAAGKIAGLCGIEGGRALNESLAVLEDFHARGVRILTLVWNDHLSWIRSCQTCDDPAIPAGLSDFGRDVVRKMNELGIIVDLSHAGVQSFYDTLEVSTKPVVASHSGCHALHAHPRNLDDDQLRALAANDGVIGIVFHTSFLDADAMAENARVQRSEPYVSIDRSDVMRAWAEMQRVSQAESAPLGINRVVEHVLHAVEVAGPRHVGIGSDYDGILRAPAGLEDASGYPRLVEALLEHGLDEATVEGIVGANFERVFREVTSR